jgi:hypothetical protein
MRLIYQVLFILILAYGLALFLPWWSIAIAAFAGGLLVKSKYNFIGGFVAIALLWLTTALIIDLAAATQLTEKVARIFTLPNKFLLFMITAMLGGLVGGFACLTGSLLKKYKE